MALVVKPIKLFSQLLIPRYDASADHPDGGVELCITKLTTRIQPPVINISLYQFCQLVSVMAKKHNLETLCKSYLPPLKKQHSTVLVYSKFLSLNDKIPVALTTDLHWYHMIMGGFECGSNLSLFRNFPATTEASGITSSLFSLLDKTNLLCRLSKMHEHWEKI